MLLSYGHWAGVDDHVPLPQVTVSQPWHAGSAVRGSGGGGLARRAIIAATAIVATAMTTIVVLDVVLVPVATVATVATAGPARWRGGWWPSCRGTVLV
jgi:hypothetical protein